MGSDLIGSRLISLICISVDLELICSQVEWDISLTTCGCAWPDLLEDRLPAEGVKHWLLSLTIDNPLVIDLDEVR